MYPPYETIDATGMRAQVIPAGQLGVGPDPTAPDPTAISHPQQDVLTPQQQRVYSAMMIANLVGFGLGAFLGYRFIVRRM